MFNDLDYMTSFASLLLEEYIHLKAEVETNPCAINKNKNTDKGWDDVLSMIQSNKGGKRFRSNLSNISLKTNSDSNSVLNLYEPKDECGSILTMSSVCTSLKSINTD